LLNVFLAIAVDNLNSAREMTAAQEEEEALMKEKKNNTLAKETKMFMNPEVKK
jgi:hypothetical protein